MAGLDKSIMKVPFSHTNIYDYLIIILFSQSEDPIGNYPRIELALEEAHCIGM